MSSQKTSNLNLHKWEPTDGVIREEFNENFSAIDAAMGALTATAGNCVIETGSYTGNGNTSKSITFSTLPDIIFINGNGIISPPALYMIYLDSTMAWPTVTVNGSKVTWKGSNATKAMNASGETYHYVALHVK